LAGVACNKTVYGPFNDNIKSPILATAEELAMIKHGFASLK
jgi:hypothetical protein